MPGLMQGLEMARRALLAHQSAMNVTGHNIANVATEGFTRRQAVLEPTVPERTPEGTLGTGVKLDGVRRNRNVFLDNQLRREASLAGRWQARAAILEQVESVIGEPSDTGLGALLDSFFNGWLELSNQPEDAGARQVVLQAGVALAQGFADQNRRFDSVLESTALEVEQRISDLNKNLDELGDLNLRIQQSEVVGAVDADLRDRRDQLLDSLAEKAGANHLVRADGSVVVRVGSRTVVEGTDVTHLAADKFTVDQRLKIRVVYASDRGVPNNLGGELGGILEVREEVIPELKGKLDQLAKSLVETVNGRHAAGPTATNFFEGTDSSNIDLDVEIKNDPSLINAGTSGDAGDNDIALSIAGLRTERVLQRGTASVGDFYRQITSQVGSLAQQAGLVGNSQRAAFESLQNQRESLHGVSLDEELTILIQTEKAYEAAAKIFQVSSRMIDTLLEL